MAEGDHTQIMEGECMAYPDDGYAICNKGGKMVKEDISESRSGGLMSKFR